MHTPGLRAEGRRRTGQEIETRIKENADRKKLPGAICWSVGGGDG